MASLKDIRARIESTKNTQQITKAMKLVSAAKLRKAQNQIVNMRPYSHTLMKVISDIAVTERVNHPLLTPPTQIKKILVVVITSDRGLCGGFNSNINRFADQYYKATKPETDALDFIFIGRRGADFFARKKIVSTETILRLDKDISYEMASRFAEKIMNFYQEKHYDEIRVIYNEFKSAIAQKVTVETLLPVDVTHQSFTQEGITVPFSTDMIYEPDPTHMIDELLVKHFSMQVYRCMAESVAAEHGARMTAMENATNNAKEVLGKLTLTYNKLRQEKITTELIEIVSGAEAL